MESNQNIFPLFCGGPHGCRQRRCARAESGASCEEAFGEEGLCTSGRDPLAGRPLAMVYAPEQAFEGLYEPEEGLARGTVFSALEMPFEGDGRWH